MNREPLKEIFFTKQSIRLLEKLFESEAKNVRDLLDTFESCHGRIRPIEVIFFCRERNNSCAVKLNSSENNFLKVRKMNYSDHAAHADFIRRQLLVELEML